GFSHVYAVSFGDTPSPDFTVLSDTTIVATAPPHTAGTIDISLRSSDDSFPLSSADRFSYTLAAVPALPAARPPTGSTAGGTRVVLTGSGFTGASNVTFGGVPASFTINSDSQITAMSPAEAAGVVDVQVTTPSGTSAVGTADHFTYTAAPAPVVSGLTPASGRTAGGAGGHGHRRGLTGGTGGQVGAKADMRCSR